MNTFLDCKEMRRSILSMALSAGKEGAHLGGALSLVEIMSVIYSQYFNEISPDRNLKENILILSKGHGVMAQYAALKELGWISDEELRSFKSKGSRLSAHPSAGTLPSIDFSTGSLGQGLSFGVGVALGMKKKELDNKVFVVLGDGELDEGQVWEAAMAASHWGLQSLIAIVDCNGIQYDEFTSEAMDLGDLTKKWQAFGWNAKVVDGHNEFELYSAIRDCCLSQRPNVIIAKTIKGKGVSFMESVPSWHSSVLTKNQYELAMKELNG